MSATEGEVRRAQRLKEQVSEKTKEQAGAAYETQRDRIVGEMEKLASALHDVAGNLREQNSSSIGANFTERAAERLDDLCNRIRKADFDSLIRDVEDYGRQHPAVLIGAASAIGFMAVRFLKSSRRGTSIVSTLRSSIGSDIAGSSPTIGYAEEP